jgi:glycosyltransferase involved in cell wall biosynthesis
MAQPPLRLLYVVTEDWYFLSHRLPMARAARDAGFEIHVATRVLNGARAIEGEGFVLHQVPFVRGKLSPVAAFATIRALHAVHKRVNPNIVHHVSLQAAILGAIAALGRPVNAINALTGMGYAYSSVGVKAALLRTAIGMLLKALLQRPRQTVLVQNSDDRDQMILLGIAQDRIVIIPGSGVDTDALIPCPEPEGPITIAFVGRLLTDKGIRTLIHAMRLVRQRGSDVRLLIAGTPDLANPASISPQEARSFGEEPGNAWLGHVDNIADVWARAHIAVLPSRREGLPKSLLEAAACGRPLIATDVPGCREIVRPWKTGLLVPYNNVAALADAIMTLAASPVLRERYGAAARRLAIEHFSARHIGSATVDLYRRVMHTDVEPKIGSEK